MAGFFFVDEVLSSSAITTIKNQMVGSTDLTTICGGASAGGCTGCSAGKYKVGPGPAACTDCTVNRYSTATEAISNTTCLSCPANTVSAIGSGILTACKCNLGYTSPSGDGNACDACVPGTYKTATGSATCTLCDLGKYSEAVALTTATCTSCDLNQMTNSTGKDEHADCRCNAGYTGNDGTHCYECDAGKYKSATGDVTCTSCPQDRYSTALAATSGATCLTCPSSSQAPQGSNAKAACICNMGYTGPGGSADPYTCTACVAGTFKTTNGSAVCTDCVAHTYSTVVAATSNTCVGCPVYMQSAVASGANTDCKCNAGYTGSDGVFCTGCVAGKYKTLPGSQVCDNCPANEFSTAVNKSDASCTTCLSVTTRPSQSLEGSALQTDCKCNMGYSGANGSECIACPRGAFKPSVGDATCSLCPTNTYQPALAQTASTHCIECPANSLSPQASDELTDCQCKSGYLGANGETCAECYAGKFKPSQGPQECDLCPNGTYSGVFAATSNGVCGPCQNNSLSWAGSTVLTDCKCDTGFFTEHFGQPTASCQTCGTGTYNTHLNATACSKCAAGLFSSAVGAKTGEVCHRCTVGFSGEGQAQCDACPPNATALTASSFLTDCKCNPGYTGPDGGTCEECVTGKFKPENGSSVCTDCPFDTYLDYRAASLESECIDCTVNSITLQTGSPAVDYCKCSVGYTSSVPGLDGMTCEACAQGRYKNVTGYYPCALCPHDTHLNAIGSTLISQCEQCFGHSVSDEGSPSVESCTCVGGFERQAS